jgi:hypothetical protein
MIPFEVVGVMTGRLGSTKTSKAKSERSLQILFSLTFDTLCSALSLIIRNGAEGGTGAHPTAGGTGPCPYLALSAHTCGSGFA